MRSRKYSRKIELWETDHSDDGYAGTTPTESKQVERWARVTTKSAGRKFQQFGLNEFKNPVIFRIRSTGAEINEDTFLKYKGRKFIIKGIERVDFEGREINILADED